MPRPWVIQQRSVDLLWNRMNQHPLVRVKYFSGSWWSNFDSSLGVLEYHILSSWEFVVGLYRCDYLVWMCFVGNISLFFRHVLTMFLCSGWYHDQSEFPGVEGLLWSRVELVLAESATIPGLDEWDYWAEGSFNLGINMWTVWGPSGGPIGHVTQPGLIHMQTCERVFVCDNE